MFNQLVKHRLALWNGQDLAVHQVIKVLSGDKTQAYFLDQGCGVVETRGWFMVKPTYNCLEDLKIETNKAKNVMEDTNLPLLKLFKRISVTLHLVLKSIR